MDIDEVTDIDSNIERILQIMRNTQEEYDNGRPLPPITSETRIGLEDLSSIDLFVYWSWYFRDW
ncbi:uncharacterized protein TrAtP1_013145 [Trichoderma atroviride]|uniref:uncharacterized protein n=1 Tax=Hypocrea atroviridis TaxID=63577 RepID=UPI0033327FCD|nr:hypothetical protein TrAtP1_013145 [Trichoderma atroviride]